MIDFAPLHQLLCAERPMDAIVGFRGAETVSWRHWRDRVALWRQHVAEHAGTRFGVFHSDAVEFAAIVFAIWAAGKVACVPGNNQPGTVSRLAARVDGFIGEFDANSSIRLLAGEPDDQLPQNIVLDADALALEIFTSGSTGEPEAIPKQLRQLINEVNNLQALWGDLAKDATVLATVSHHHIYGLLFRVLWSLSAARPFDAHAADYWEAINQRATEWREIILVSSPSHLSRMPPAMDWTRLRARCVGVFSSGAPLLRESSLQAAHLLGFAPLEIFGSSETGGIAWRQQSAEREALWTPVPGLAIAADAETNGLRIRSPYLASDAWYATQDRVEIADNSQQFRLLGRMDRIAKVEGKRLSLTEMERQLENHALVSRARVVLLQGSRSEIGAVIELNQNGSDYLHAHNRRALNQLLQRHLSQWFERPLLPRRWRYPPALPLNSEGKVIQQRLHEMFETKERTRPVLPEVVSSQQEGGNLQLTLAMPPDLIYFEGHFPAVTILPGVVQVHWAEHYARERLNLTGEFSHLEVIKFQHVIRPAQQVQLHLAYDEQKRKLQFSYSSTHGQHASGRLAFKAD